jgi:ferric-dicitrate binding protein FerR (iron transport regulator)
MTLQEAKKFVARFVTREYGPDEQATFQIWLNGATVDEWNQVADEHEALIERWPIVGIAPSAEWISGMESRLDNVTVEKETPVVEMSSTSSSMQGGRSKVWMAAASVAAVIALGALWYTQQGKSKVEVVHNEPVAAPVLAQHMDVQRGERAKQLVLPDGSKVWLNSASTLKYPTTFGGPVRVVQLSGEAFFEVAKDANKPFKVMIKDAEVDVLGTKFDIMAYDDEHVSKTTLMDGVVKIRTGSHEFTMNPGDQVQVNYPLSPIDQRTGGIATMAFIPNVNIVNVSSWLKGGVEFENADLGEVMRSMGRYYNVDIQYAKDLPVRTPITVGFNLQDGLPQNLKRLEHWFHLTFRTDGKIVTVTYDPKHS